MHAAAFGPRACSAAFAAALGLAIAASPGIATADDDAGSPANSPGPRSSRSHESGSAATTSRPRPSSRSGVPRSAGPRVSARPDSNTTPDATVAGDPGTVGSPPNNDAPASPGPAAARADATVAAREFTAAAAPLPAQASAITAAPPPVAPPAPIVPAAGGVAAAATVVRAAPTPTVQAKAIAVQSAAPAQASPTGIVSGLVNLLRAASPGLGSGAPGAPRELAAAALLVVRREIENLLSPVSATAAPSAAASTRWSLASLQKPTVSIADANVAEGNSGTSTMAFTVTLSKASTSSVTVKYATSNGTARAGSDYLASSGKVTFAAGETSKTVSVGVIGDTVVESNETFTVKLSAPSGATLARASATGTITNDDTTNTTGPTVPFGSHLRPYATGTLLPSGSQATLDAAVVSLYNKWKSNFLVSAGDYGIAVKAGADYPYVSEGQGYGMEITVLMAGADPAAQSSFDGILKYVLAHPSSGNPALHASEQNSSFVSVNGGDSATDGDISIAYALLLADRQWGSAGTYNYKQLAITRINAIKTSEMNPKTYLPTLGDWNTPDDSLYNSVRPSDLMIDHFRAFKAATNDPFWDSAVTAAQNVIAQQQNTYAPTTGLIADFVVNTNTTPAPAPANFLEGKTDGQYAYNSVRVPWHLGVDAAVYGDSVSKAEAQKITAWFRSKTGDDPSKIVSGYKLDGTPTVSYLDPEFVATLGPAAMGNSANQAWLDKIWAYTVAQSNTSAANSYYSASLMLQSMLVMSGNYWTA